MRRVVDIENAPSPPSGKVSPRTREMRIMTARKHRANNAPELAAATFRLLFDSGDMTVAAELYDTCIAMPHHIEDAAHCYCVYLCNMLITPGPAEPLPAEIYQIVIQSAVDGDSRAMGALKVFVNRAMPPRALDPEGVRAASARLVELMTKAASKECTAAEKSACRTDIATCVYANRDTVGFLAAAVDAVRYLGAPNEMLLCIIAMSELCHVTPVANMTDAKRLKTCVDAQKYVARTAVELDRYLSTGLLQ